jgi:hypothetical protein
MHFETSEHQQRQERELDKTHEIEFGIGYLPEIESMHLGQSEHQQRPERELDGTPEIEFGIETLLECMHFKTSEHQQRLEREQDKTHETEFGIGYLLGIESMQLQQSERTQRQERTQNEIVFENLHEIARRRLAYLDQIMRTLHQPNYALMMTRDNNDPSEDKQLENICASCMKLSKRQWRNSRRTSNVISASKDSFYLQQDSFGPY